MLSDILFPSPELKEKKNMSEPWLSFSGVAELPELFHHFIQTTIPKTV